MMLLAEVPLRVQHAIVQPRPMTETSNGRLPQHLFRGRLQVLVQAIGIFWLTRCYLRIDDALHYTPNVHMPRLR